jgi:hypothetical protein
MIGRAALLMLVLTGPAGGETLRMGALEGTLLRPAGAAPPVALIIAGSGPTDRNGNQPGLVNDHLRHLAAALAAEGIATLRTDKRGVAASAAAAPDESALTPQVYARDAAGWLALLDARPDLGPVSVIGHSEGALIATLAAQAHPVAALVLLAGAGEPADRLIARQLAAAGLPEPLQQASAAISAALQDGTPLPAIPPALAPLYRPSVRPYLSAWFRLDPAAELAQVPAGIPVMIAQGGTDLQVFPDQADRLAAARPDAQVLRIAGMNHILRPAPADRAANLATYADPSLPLAPGLAPAIAAALATASQR